jgi:hypothetical protein
MQEVLQAVAEYRGSWHSLRDCNTVGHHMTSTHSTVGRIFWSPMLSAHMLPTRQQSHLNVPGTQWLDGTAQHHHLLSNL